ncbi:hypothetical protein Taro_011731 [Colocasia esculenta]|uniref:Uncharacterized protein n=1 Tax=Colocasia esculenta TaxID=4460 RepID=A0A843UBN8_COLES|nr:hypothetical protein [Colocasia esculenta]
MASSALHRQEPSVLTLPCGTQARSHEELSSSSWLEDGKKVPSIISRTEENATVEGDATRRRVHQGRRVIIVGATDSPTATPELEQEKNSEVKRAQLGVVPGWVTFLGSLPTGTVVGPVCWLGRHKWYQSLTQPEVQELSATQGKVLRYGSHLLKP